MPRINAWSRFDDYVAEIAAHGPWRVTERETAIGVHEGSVRQMVADVILPPVGPAFVAEVSRDSGSVDLRESQVTARQLTKAVKWLPSLAASSSAARDLLRELRDRVNEEDQARIDAVLAVEPLHEIEERPAPIDW